jgi:hypothetical protein
VQFGVESWSLSQDASAAWSHTGADVGLGLALLATSVCLAVVWVFRRFSHACCKGQNSDAGHGTGGTQHLKVQ